MEQIFKTKCNLLNERLNVLYAKISELKLSIIIQDLSKTLDKNFHFGVNIVNGLEWIKKIYIDDGVFTLANENEDKYFAYTVYTEKEYNTIDLGFLYNGDIIAPHIENQIDCILSKYKMNELTEILKIIDKKILLINQDIEYLENNQNPSLHKHYYGEYNKGFDSHTKFATINDVFDDYKKQ